MDFLGFKQEKNELILVEKERFRLATVVNRHNLLRIRRIFASLHALSEKTLVVMLCNALKRENSSNNSYSIPIRVVRCDL